MNKVTKIKIFVKYNLMPFDKKSNFFRAATWRSFRCFHHINGILAVSFKYKTISAGIHGCRAAVDLDAGYPAGTCTAKPKQADPSRRRGSA
jgi:hypothetical protein